MLSTLLITLEMAKKTSNKVILFTVFAGFKSELKGSFETVRECRLKATRKESSEIYIFAKNYKPSS